MTRALSNCYASPPSLEEVIADAKRARAEYISETASWLKRAFLEFEERSTQSERANARTRRAHLEQLRLNLKALDASDDEASMRIKESDAYQRLRAIHRSNSWNTPKTFGDYCTLHIHTPLMLTSKAYQGFRKLRTGTKLALIPALIGAYFTPLAMASKVKMAFILGSSALDLATLRSKDKEKFMGAFEWNGQGALWNLYDKIHQDFPEANLVKARELIMRPNRSLGYANSPDMPGAEFFRINSDDNPGWIAGYYDPQYKSGSYVHTQLDPLGFEVMARGFDLHSCMQLQEEYADRPEALATMYLLMLKTPFPVGEDDKILTGTSRAIDYWKAQAEALNAGGHQGFINENALDLVVTQEARDQLQALFTGQGFSLISSEGKCDADYWTPEQAVRTMNMPRDQRILMFNLWQNSELRQNIGFDSAFEVCDRYAEPDPYDRLRLGWGERICVWFTQIPCMRDLSYAQWKGLADEANQDPATIERYVQFRNAMPECNITHDDLMVLARGLSTHDKIKWAAQGMQAHGLSADEACEYAQPLSDMKSLSEVNEEFISYKETVARAILDVTGKLPETREQVTDLAGIFGFEAQRLRGVEDSLPQLQNAFKVAVRDVEDAGQMPPGNMDYTQAIQDRFIEHVKTGFA